MSSGRRYKQIGRWDNAGVIITFVHRLSGDRQTAIWPHGSKQEAIRRLCAMFDPNVWRADVVSTAQTIYDDITFGRTLVDPAAGERGREKRGQRRDTVFSTGGTRKPEPTLLGQAGCSAWL